MTATSVRADKGADLTRIEHEEVISSDARLAVALSKIKSLEERLADLTAQKLAVDECNATFAQNLRNPLVTAATAASALESVSEDDNVRSIARMLQRTLRRANYMLLDLLDVRQNLSHQAPSLDVEEYDLIPDCKAAIDSAGTSFNRIINLTAPPRLSVNWSRDYIQRALTNLLDNAAQHSITNVPISVQIENDRAEVRVEIRYRPGDAQHSRYTNALGHAGASIDGDLKLASAAAIVGWHRGTIQVSNQPDRATTFMLFLPHRTRK